MKKQTFQRILLVVAIAFAGTGSLSASETFDNPRSSEYVQTSISKINNFIEVRGGLDRVKEDANAGDAEANYWLGVMYRDGVVFDKDGEEARRYFALSAHNENANGLYEYSKKLSGDGDTDDKARSGSLLAKSASLGNPEAQYQLALHYLNGEGVPRSRTIGYFWLSKASANGFPEATLKEKELIEMNPQLDESFDEAHARAITGHVPSIVRLARFYAEGIKVEKNTAFATELLKNAASLGSEEAKAILSE